MVRGRTSDSLRPGLYPDTYCMYSTYTVHTQNGYFKYHVFIQWLFVQTNMIIIIHLYSTFLTHFFFAIQKTTIRKGECLVQYQRKRWRVVPEAMHQTMQVWQPLWIIISVVGQDSFNGLVSISVVPLPLFQPIGQDTHYYSLANSCQLPCLPCWFKMLFQSSWGFGSNLPHNVAHSF